MIVSVVGMDRVGKSTLSELLAKDLDAKYTHFSNPKDMEDGKKQYFDFLDKIDNKKNYVCDRFYDGEWVYAPIYRGYTANYMDEIENKIRNTDKYIMIYVTSSLEKIIERIKVNGEDFVKEEHYQTVLDNFKNNFLMNQKMPFAIVDTTYGSIDTNYNYLKNSYDKIKKILDEQINLGVEVLPRGNINAKYMIIGNSKSNPMINEKTNYEFISSLKEANIYLSCWFSYACSKNMDSLHNQIELVNPYKIIAIDPVTYEFLKRKYNNVILLEENNNYSNLTELFKMLDA